MQYIDGERFSSASEYADALEDKNKIESIKKSCDLSTPEGVKNAYLAVHEMNFKTIIGKKFDDEIYDLYEKVKNETVTKDVSFGKRKGIAGKKSSSKKTDNLNNVSSKKTDNSNKKRTASTSKDKHSSSTDSMDLSMKKAVVKEIKRQNRNRSVLIALLLVIGFGSIGYFVKYYNDAREVQKQSDEFSELKDDKYADLLKNVTQVIKKDYSEEVVIPDILDEYLALYNKNKSLIGWIKIADTIIDYPVMQTTDNEYYLKHNFNQENDNNGCIFMDYNCDVILGNDNWILYGHHMKNGKMFSILQNYANKDFYEKHKTISFDTIYEKGTFEVMYIFRSRIYNADEIVFKYYQFIDANSKEEFDSYMEEMDKLSLIDTGVTAEYGDKLLTLSTCDYQEANGRFVVVAKKID